MKNKQSGFILPLLIAIITVLLIGGGTYLYTKNSSNVSLPEGSTNGTTTSTHLLNFTSKYGFSLQYPSDWKIIDSATGIVINGPVRYDVKESSAAGSYFSQSVGVSNGNISADLSGAFFVQIHKGNFAGEDNIDRPNDQSIQNMPEYQTAQKIIQSIKFLNPTISTTSSSSAIAVVGMTKYTDATYGFSLYYPSAWKITPKNQNGGYNDIGVINFDNIGPNKDDSIDITVQEGNQVTTTDSKFGTIHYSYDSKIGGWTMMGSADIGVGGPGSLSETIPQPAKILYNTPSNLPVFAGTTRWKTNIVALSTTKFLVIHITGSGWSTVVDPLTKTVSVAGQNVDAIKLNAAVNDELTASMSRQ